MSTSQNVKGFIPPDAKFKQMLDAYNACDKAGVAIPPAVDAFFNGERPDPQGVQIDLEAKKYRDAVQPWHDEMQDGFEIDLTKLPEDIKIIRFYTSY